MTILIVIAAINLTTLILILVTFRLQGEINNLQKRMNNLLSLETDCIKERIERLEGRNAE